MDNELNNSSNCSDANNYSFTEANSEMNNNSNMNQNNYSYSNPDMGQNPNGNPNPFMGQNPNGNPNPFMGQNPNGNPNGNYNQFGTPNGSGNHFYNYGMAPNGSTYQAQMPGKTKIMKDNFAFFGLGCLIYGIVFAICTYNGFFNIMLPVLTIVTQILLVKSFKYFDIAVTKKTWFHLVSWLLLSISNVLSANPTMDSLNVVAICLLLLSLLITHFVDTSEWELSKFIQEIVLAPIISLEFVEYPFKALKSYTSEKKSKKNEKAIYIWTGVFIGVPLVIVIIALLCSADAVFESYVNYVLDNIKFPEHWFRFLFCFFLGSVGSYALISYMCSERIKNNLSTKAKKEPIIAITFTSMLTVVYILFSFIQISYLFLEEFELPDNYTYAKYAREGFFQLLVVCFINLLIIQICLKIFRRHKALSVILSVFSGCTFIMIISSAMRMILYISEYDLTLSRVMVLWALVVITLLLVGCFITIFKTGFPLFRYTTIVITICYVILSISCPGKLIAKYNVENHGDNFDLMYLIREIGADAVPILEDEDLIDDWTNDKSEYYKNYKDVYYVYGNSVYYELNYIFNDYKNMGPFNFNYSLYKAGKILED